MTVATSIIEASSERGGGMSCILSSSLPRAGSVRPSPLSCPLTVRASSSVSPFSLGKRVVDMFGVTVMAVRELRAEGSLPREGQLSVLA